MIRISQVKMPINYNEKMLFEQVVKLLGVDGSRVKNYKINKRSLDARKKDKIHYSFVIDVEINNELKVIGKKKNVQIVNSKEYVYPKLEKEKNRPIIVGFGPAGLFAAYILAEVGLKPLVFERGEDVDSRTKTVEEFWSKGLLNEESNVQFGEGGAGTFSDGKLTTRSKDIRGKKVLQILVEHGAPEEILYINKPHVGTDVLKPVVKSMREKIIRLGGEIHFNTKVVDFILEDNVIKGVQLSKGNIVYSDEVILAIGHSSRETYKKLYERKIMLEQKPFAMGVRIEHLQETIDENQYGDKVHANILGAADYKLTYKTSNGRSVYSFCVCPGGMVVASSSENGGLVVNGMSEHARDQININGALLVQVETSDFGSKHPLAGIEFQRKYEKLAFLLGGSNYSAPAETVGSFLSNDKNYHTNILPSYRPEVKYVNLSECLPEFVVDSLKEGIINFGKKVDGFSSFNSILTGIETRSSAPVRILRSNENMESLNIKGLYPVGEGAGYAGGIISAAIDGIRVAEVVTIK